MYGAVTVNTGAQQALEDFERESLNTEWGVSDAMEMFGLVLLNNADSWEELEWDTVRRVGNGLLAFDHIHQLGGDTGMDFARLLAARAISPDILQSWLSSGILTDRHIHLILREAYPELAESSRAVVNALPPHLRSAGGWPETS